MRLLDKYITKSVLSSIVLVTLMLIGLQIFILLVHEINNINANYGIWQATCYVLLQMPYQVYLFFPMASLLGCLIGLGIMANHRELVVMRAAGMSIWQVTLAVLKAALLLILVVTLVGETIVPKLGLISKTQKMHAVDGQALRTASGVWLRYKNNFITIGTVLPNNDLLNVFQFRFDKQYHLRLARKIERVEYNQGHWQAYGVSETTFEDQHIRAATIPELPWDVSIHPSILSASRSEPDEMTLLELHNYLHVQKKNHQSSANFQLAYWQRLIQPLTTLVMMVLAIPFIFGPLRSSTMGSKLIVGSLVAFSFHMINHFFGPVGEVLQLPPIVSGLGPTLVFGLLGLYMMRKVR